MKRIEIEFGASTIGVTVPDATDVLARSDAPPCRDPVADVRRSLRDPIGCLPLAELVRRQRKPGRTGRAVVVVSDLTRPVPYTGPAGILCPVLDVLRREHVADTTILVATGTHRPMQPPELRRLLPPEAFQAGVRVVNHDATDDSALVHIGATVRGGAAWVNRVYMEADVKILTGLVEPHFMAGFSGGRKSICPGLIGLAGTHVFHGPAMMLDPRADSLILEGNPCHEEALDIARMAGCDFILNVAMDRHRRVTGVYGGDMEAAHQMACAEVGQANAIRIRNAYDVVLTHAGVGGINHYQAAKAACEASKAVKPGGRMVIAANHTDVDPVGGESYRRVLPLLRELGPDALDARLRSKGWTFVPEQWEVQMWGRAMRQLGSMDNLIYCAPRLTGKRFAEGQLPGVDGGWEVSAPDDRSLAEAMVQRALDSSLRDRPGASLAVLVDGPYGVPVPDSSPCH